jgi:hypothetical protein
MLLRLFSLQSSSLSAFIIIKFESCCCSTLKKLQSKHVNQTKKNLSTRTVIEVFRPNKALNLVGEIPQKYCEVFLRVSPAPFDKPHLGIDRVLECLLR